jgi:hypothetical protein
MTRKDYVVIAKALLDTKPIGSHGRDEVSQWEYTVTVMMDRLAGTNPRFDKTIFAKACGYEL